MSRIIRINAPFDGYRRGGILHRKGSHDHPIENFTKAQQGMILMDHRLTAQIIDLPEPEAEAGAAPASAGEPLLGSSHLPNEAEMPDGSMLPMVELAAVAQRRSGLSASDWNGLGEDERDRQLRETGQLLMARQLINMELALRGSGSPPSSALARIYNAFPIFPEGRSGTAREAPSAGSGDDASQAPSGTQSAAHLTSAGADDPAAPADTPSAPAGAVTDAGGQAEAVTGTGPSGEAGEEAGAEKAEAAPASNSAPKEPAPKKPAAKARKGKAS